MPVMSNLSLSFRMMSASEDGTIQLWNVELLKEGGEMVILGP